MINSVDSNQVIFVSNRNLAHLYKVKNNKEIVTWNVFCPRHKNITLGDNLMRRQEKVDIEAVVHAECRPKVIDVAATCMAPGDAKTRKN